MTKDIPIIFSAPMIRALLDGRKTMTRRLAFRPIGAKQKVPDGAKVEQVGNVVRGLVPSPWQRVLPGVRLWVREAWAQDDTGTRYYATDDVHELRRKRSPIHMPRWASRLTLIVTATKIERVQQISFEDAIAEGMADFATFLTGKEGPAANERETAEDCARRLRWPQRWFQGLWNDLHGADSWDANSEVVALTFTVHRANIDALPKSEAA